MKFGRLTQSLDNWRDAASDMMEGSPLLGIFKYFLVLLLVFITALGWYWSREPDLFTIDESIVRVEPSKRQITGVATTSAMLNIMEVLLNKPGGYIHNDRLPPGVLMDNMPNWEYGVIVQVRDMARAMRESFSRSQSQSREDVDLAKAEPRFNFQANSWILPSTESEYREGMRLMQNYLTRLTDDDINDAQFYARADNLQGWLAMVSSRLGSLSQRLSASVGQVRFDTSLQGDSAAEQSTKTDEQMMIKTPWNEIDDVFYESRGTTWALIELLSAVDRDFASVLAKKNASVSLKQIIRELEETQAIIYSPIILNGSGFGFVANHSLAMASYISRANAALIDLQDLLDRG